MKWFGLRQNFLNRWIIVHPVFHLGWSGSRWVAYDYVHGLPDEIQLANFSTVEEAAKEAAALHPPSQTTSRVMRFLTR